MEVVRESKGKGNGKGNRKVRERVWELPELML